MKKKFWITLLFRFLLFPIISLRFFRFENLKKKFADRIVYYVMIPSPTVDEWLTSTGQGSTSVEQLWKRVDVFWWLVGWLWLSRSSLRDFVRLKNISGAPRHEALLFFIMWFYFVDCHYVVLFNCPISFIFAPNFKHSWLGTTKVFRHTFLWIALINVFCNPFHCFN